MKKFFTLIAILSVTFAGAQAQGIDNSYQFADKDGNIIEDGTTVVRNEPEIDPFGGVAMQSGIFIKNVSAPQNNQVRIHTTITRLDNGNVQVCFPTVCHSYNTTGYTNQSENGKIATGELKSIQAEWLPNGTEAYGECIVKHQAFALTPFGKNWIDNEGPTITVHYIFADPAGISQHTAQSQPAAWYDAQGRQLTAPARGLNVVRLSDGSVRKVYRK